MPQVWIYRYGVAKKAWRVLLRLLLRAKGQKSLFQGGSPVLGGDGKDSGANQCAVSVKADSPLQFTYKEFNEFSSDTKIGTCIHHEEWRRKHE
jgi:hypothetical protein